MRKLKWPMSLAACIGAALALASCAGSGMKFSEISSALTNTCAKCHDAAHAQQKLDEIHALPDSAFTDEAFPAAQFPKDLQGKSTLDLKNGGDSWLDGTEPQQKAWILHEMHELFKLLSEDPPPDYTTQQKFTTFVTSGKPGAQEGCEMERRLDLGRKGDTNEGMPPQWAKKLMQLLGVDFVDITDAERTKIRDYLDQLLPGGVKACSSVTGEVS
jgi:hypothetical protein